MRRILNIFLFTIGVLLAAFGFITYKDGNSLFIPLSVVGLGLVIFSSVKDFRFAKHRQEEYLEEVNNRVTALTQKPWMSEQSLEVHNSKSMLLLLLIVAGISLYTAYSALIIAPPKLLLGIGASILSFLFTFTLVRASTGISNPDLILNRNGLTSPIFGYISWQEVEGVDLQIIHARNTTNYALIFKVSNYSKIATNIHWTERMLGGLGLGAIGRGRLLFPLQGAEEKPETITAVAKFLWHQSTGNNDDWGHLHSAEYNEASKRLDLILEQSKNPDAFDKLSLNNPVDLEQVKRDLDIVTSEGRLVVKKTNAILLVFLLIGLFCLGLVLFKIFKF